MTAGRLRDGTGGPVRGARTSGSRAALRPASAPVAPEPAPPGIELVPVRPFLLPGVVARVGLAPGDRALVAPGEPVIAGTPLAERLRDPQLGEAPALPGEDHRRPGDRIVDETGGRSLRRAAAAAGELVFRSGRRWRVATGEVADPIEAPAAGIVRDVRSGTAIAIELEGAALAGVFAIGTPSRGSLALADGPGDLHQLGLDVGLAGAILVVGGRVDAESLTRARAMGIRGVVVPALSGKELRDFNASERRQRAAFHRLTPFGVLVLDGILRRPIASPIIALLEGLAGREVGIVVDPPALVIPGMEPVAPPTSAAWVRVRGGPHGGREGRFVRPLGRRRFDAGLHLESALVALDAGAPVVVPLADLERFVPGA